MNNDLKLLIGENERILYEGKPNKRCFIFESIFNPLLPFAILWLMFDLFFISGFIATGDVEGIAFFLIPFMLFHMMPVWIYLGGVIMTMKRYRNTEYIVTDQAVYISGGIINKTINRKSFMEMSRVNLHRGFFDQKFGVGDIILTSNQLNSNNTSSATNINSISEYAEVYKMIQKLQKDIYTDVMYPNDKRPQENHGYNTNYKGF